LTFTATLSVWRLGRHQKFRHKARFSSDTGTAMPLLALLGLLLILAIVLGPSLWVRATLALYAAQRSDILRTGAELTRHLLDRFGLETVAVEAVAEGHHYDPDARAVRLAPNAHEGCSVVAVAAHEVGHAIQQRDINWDVRKEGGSMATAISLAAPK